MEATKVKGRSKASLEKINGGEIALGIRGTGYIRRVIYGEFLENNVYLYTIDDGNTAVAYNGTTENH